MSVSLSVLSCFLILYRSPHPSLPSCEMRKGLPDPVHINQSFLPAALGARGMHCVLWNTLCDIINLFLAQASGWKGVELGPVGD